MLKRLLLLWTLLLCVTVPTKAQELTIPQLSQYIADNPFLQAPTYAGVGDHIRVRLNGLSQWVGIEDAPDTQTLAVDARVGNRSGLGVVLFNDSNGFTSQRGSRLSFAHHLTLDRYEDIFLSFGLSYNFNLFRVDVESIGANNGQQLFDDRRTVNHNFDIGTLYRYGKFYISLNASNLLDKSLDGFQITNTLNPVAEPNQLRNYFLYAGYNFAKDKNSKIELEPSIFFQYFESDGRSVTDLNLKVRFRDFEDYYYAGLTYRFLNDQDQTGSPLFLAPIAGLKKKNFFFGYSYQVILNEILGFSTGTHVLTVGTDLFQGISNCRCTY